MCDISEYAASEIDRLVSSLERLGPEHIESLKLKMLDAVDWYDRLSGSAGPHQSRVVIGYLQRLAYLKPLSPLTGEADEWLSVHRDSSPASTTDRLEQNIRCRSVYRVSGDNLRAYDIRKAIRDGSRPEESGKISFPYSVP